MEKKSQEALDMIHNFFKENQVELPEEVNKSLLTAFEENDFDGDLDDPINIYFKNNLKDFIADVKTSTTIDMELNGSPSGTVFSHYNYYGNTKTSYSEKILLESNGKVLETISEIPEAAPTHFDSNDYAVLVIEELRFLEGEITRIPRLYIYCPEEEKVN